MAPYDAAVQLVSGGKAVNGKSMLQLLAAGIPYGAAVTVECSGKDEAAMLAQAIWLLESGCED